MSAEETQWGVMHPGGQMVAVQAADYPFRSRRMAMALAKDLDDPDYPEDACDCGRRGHRVMRRTVGPWMTT